jgi:polysaccharide pyruvyl transferase WcaK-like protein
MSGIGRAAEVALAGYYGRGNFGDDLMAVLFGFMLRRVGADFTIYRLDRNHAGRFGFDTADSARSLLESAQLLLWGGGGLLVSWSPILHDLLFPGISSEYAAIVETAQRLHRRFCALSVGGSGDSPPFLTPSYKQAFLSHAEYVSVRNPQDLALLQRNGVRGDCYPDVVWQTADHFPATPRKRGTARIGIDLYFSNLGRRHALHILPMLWRITRIRRDCEFICMDSTNANSRPYRGLGMLIRGRNVRRYQFCDLNADLEFLSSLDLLVSSRLHTLMVCLGYGVPALSVFGERKTTLMMHNLGLSGCVLEHGKMNDLFSLFAQSTRLKAMLEHFRFPDVSRLRMESYGHQHQLRTLLN